MAECKDCIHDKVCPIWDYYNDCFEERNADTCKNYLPTADVVEVVRCKDCKINVSNMDIDPLDETDYSGDDIVCSRFATDGMLPNDFCSYGKRRDT